MDYTNFVNEAAQKRRTIADLARFISTRTDNNPNYSLLFGAGCSISSGVRSASQLADEWRTELYRNFAGDFCGSNPTKEEMINFLRSKENAWYDPSREYSSLFEKRYDLQRQRRMFVETEVAGKTPSIGYAYLTALVEQNYFNTIFTTNFDDILNEAFYAYSSFRPIVCAHDSSINSITVTSKRPKIIKIHGDYLFDDLKSTMRETENLEQNMKAKFMEFAKDYGLIVVGYSGGDRSVMDVLASLLRNEEFLKHGVYWCLRKNSEVCEELRKLIWRDRVYFVEIEGFDELFAELFSVFNHGEVLPQSASLVVEKPYEIANKLLESATAFPTTSPVMLRARTRLEGQTKRTNLLSLLIAPRPDGTERRLSRDDLDDDDLLKIAQVQSLVASDSYEQAIKKITEYLNNDGRPHLRIRLLQLLFDAHRTLGQTELASSVIAQLVSVQPKHAAPHLMKASLFQRADEKLRCIDQGISVNPYSVSARADKARLLKAQANEAYGEERVRLVASARSELEKGIELNPAMRNICWEILFDLIDKHVLDKDARRTEHQRLVDQLSIQNPLSPVVLGMRQRMLDKDSPRNEIEDLIDAICESKDRARPDFHPMLERIHLATMRTSRMPGTKLVTMISPLRTEPAALRDSGLVLEMATCLRDVVGQDEEAAELLSKAVNLEYDEQLVEYLISTYVDLGKLVEAESVFQKWNVRLVPSQRSRIKVLLAEGKGELTSALAEIRRRLEETGVTHHHHEAYMLLRLKQWAEAERMLREYLQPIQFTPEAGVYIINYELARKQQNHKVNVERVTAAMKFGDRHIKVGGNALLGRKADLMSSIKDVLDIDKSFRFAIRNWPVLDEFRDDLEFVRLIGPMPPQIPLTSNVIPMHATAA